MPWKERWVMDERVRFVACRLAGEPMANRAYGLFGWSIRTTAA
jgi:hypothetical protein